MRDSFIFYRSFYEAIRDLPRDVQGEIFTAIAEYGLYGNETEQLKPIARSVFTLVKSQLDCNWVRYENGKKGGRPKTESKPNQNQTKTERKPNKNQNETKQEPNANHSFLDENSHERDINNLNIRDNLNINNNSLSPLPSPSLKDETDEEFERFWDLYDKKQDKKKCEAKFKKLSKEDKAKIFETLPAYVESTKDDKQFRKNPLTYLTGECWLNEIINRNGTRQSQNQTTWQSNDLSKFRDPNRHYSNESDI